MAYSTHALIMLKYKHKKLHFKSSVFNYSIKHYNNIYHSIYVTELSTLPFFFGIKIILFL